jgi:hypothetical protein
MPASSINLLALGLERLLSQFTRVLFLTPIRIASCACVKPHAWRALIIRVLKIRAGVFGLLLGMKSRRVMNEPLPYYVKGSKSKG